MGWEVYPEGMFEMLGQVHSSCGFPAIYITENGAAFPDHVESDGQVNDPARISYIKRHLEQLLRAVTMGVPIKGYFVWSLMDNFEWALGTSTRFGLIRVDFATQKRTVKASGRWYQRLIQRNALE